METTWTEILWRQFGAAIDTLDNALDACPEELWGARIWSEPSKSVGYSQFWYVAYHALFWLDLYLSGSEEGFTPPDPYTLIEMDPAGLLPERQYTKSELRSYLEHGRQKCYSVIEALTDETAHRRCNFPWGEVSFVELQLYSMRHVQEHASQLNLFLGQQDRASGRWVGCAK